MYDRNQPILYMIYLDVNNLYGHFIMKLLLYEMLHLISPEKISFKQTFHAFLFNIRNYPPAGRSVQRYKTELNITLRRMNNFGIKQKMAWNISFTIYHNHQKKLSEC